MLIGLIGGLTLVTIVSLWGVVRLSRYALQGGADPSQALQWASSIVLQFFRLTVGAMVLIEVWGGLAHWLTAAYRVVF